ncbi:hypothetical protein OIV83_005832 [Microbotryomycetes sp. JL201]|nr:hypothetical protein OIV83_005832 [Microbotryomycetes sp. JL201]
MYAHKEALGKGMTKWQQYKRPGPANGKPIAVPREGSRDPQEHRNAPAHHHSRADGSSNNTRHDGHRWRSSRPHEDRQDYRQASQHRQDISYHRNTQTGNAYTMENDFDMSHAYAAARESTARRDLEEARKLALARREQDAKLDSLNEREAKRQAAERRKAEERKRKREAERLSSSAGGSSDIVSFASPSFDGISTSSTKTSVTMPTKFQSAPETVAKNKAKLGGEPVEIDLCNSPPKSPQVGATSASEEKNDDKYNLRAMFNKEKEQQLRAYDAELEHQREIEQKDKRLKQRVIESDDEAQNKREKSLDPLLAEGKLRISMDIQIDPRTLCPFCSRTMPSQPSPTLLKLKNYLLSLDLVEDRPTALNPLAKRLPSAQTASFCRMHEDEAVVIPEGKARGWPKSIDWQNLSRRIDRLQDRILNIIRGEQPSHFFEIAKNEWLAKGRKVKTVMSEYESFEIEQPGYYGSRGKDFLSDHLAQMFYNDCDLVTSKRIAPLDKDWFMRRVLVPETAVMLIMQDNGLEDAEEGRVLCEESRAYGRAMFPSVSAKDDDAEFSLVATQRPRESDEEVGDQKSLACEIDLSEKRSIRQPSPGLGEGMDRKQESVTAETAQNKSAAIFKKFGLQQTLDVPVATRDTPACMSSSENESALSIKNPASDQKVLKPTASMASARNDSDSDSVQVSSPPRTKRREHVDKASSHKKDTACAKEQAMTSQKVAQLRAVIGDSSDDDIPSDVEIKKQNVATPWNSGKIKKRSKAVFSGAADGILVPKKHKKRK